MMSRDQSHLLVARRPWLGDDHRARRPLPRKVMQRRKDAWKAEDTLMVGVWLWRLTFWTSHMSIITVVSTQ